MRDRPSAFPLPEVGQHTLFQQAFHEPRTQKSHTHTHTPARARNYQFPLFADAKTLALGL